MSVNEWHMLLQETCFLLVCQDELATAFVAFRRDPPAFLLLQRHFHCHAGAVLVQMPVLAVQDSPILLFLVYEAVSHPMVYNVVLSGLPVLTPPPGKICQFEIHHITSS